MCAQILQLKTSAAERAASQEQAVESAVMELAAELEATPAPGEGDEKEYRQVAADAQAVQDHYAEIQATYDETKARVLQKERELASLRKEGAERRESLSRDLAEKREIAELYHVISGLYWENEEVGYVLSEDIAKPVRYDTSLAATEQLWEMLDM